MILILFLKTCFCVQETAEILVDTACRMPTNLKVCKACVWITIWIPFSLCYWSLHHVPSNSTKPTQIKTITTNTYMPSNILVWLGFHINLSVHFSFNLSLLFHFYCLLRLCIVCVRISLLARNCSFVILICFASLATRLNPYKWY